MEPLSSSESDDLRVMASGYFVSRLSGNQVEELLDEYLAKPTYYYNVVCLIDRVLYAPQLMRREFTRKLGGGLNAS